MGHTVSKGYQIRQGLSERFCFSYLIVQQRSAQAAIVKKTMSRMQPTIRYEDRCNKSSLVSIWKEKKKQENENKCKLLALPFVLQKVLEFLDLHIKISWTKMRTIIKLESVFFLRNDRILVLLQFCPKNECFLSDRKSNFCKKLTGESINQERWHITIRWIFAFDKLPCLKNVG